MTTPRLRACQLIFGTTPRRAKLDPVGRLVYRSNMLGADQRITNTGGGNTSSKITEKDPLTGKIGRSAVGQRFRRRPAHLDPRELLVALHGQARRPDSPLSRDARTTGRRRRPRTTWSALYPHCTFNLNPRASSIDTPLHAFIPHKHVDHMHPNAVIAIAASRHAERLMHEIYGDDMAYMPWLRPGFELGLRCRNCARRTRSASRS